MPTSRPLTSGTLAAGAIEQIFEKRLNLPRKSLYLKNKGADAIRLVASDTKTDTSRLTIDANDYVSFPPYIYGFHLINGEVIAMIHCEWLEDVWLHNPSGNPVDYEAMETF